VTETASHIAVVDDDPSVRKALARLLSVFSYHVQTYASVAEFLQSLKVNIPACLIVDLQMEGMTGLELQHHLRISGPRIPTIVVTAHEEPGLQDRCKDAGAAAVLLKPVAKDQLLAAIEATTRAR
jgi:FixJ family two-component response regulator